MYDAHCSAMIQLFLVCLRGPWHIVCEKHVTQNAACSLKYDD